MPLPKSKNAVGLGNSLMNDRFGKGKGADRKKVSHNAAAIQRKGINGETYITNPNEEASYVKMRSITEQAALDEFLNTAELAGTDFTAERLSNVKIIHSDQKNPYLLSAADERNVVRKQQKNRGRLTVPRRPKWSTSTTARELDTLERESFLEWRRGLAELQENQDLLMTPFERNLEVWRQLWRVIERSDLVVQIVDARNPLLFRSDDLGRYVNEVDSKKRNLLLVNKADMMTLQQREAWADYFEEHGIRYKFFSAALAKESNEKLMEEEEEAEVNGTGNMDKTDKGGSHEESESEDDNDGGGTQLPVPTKESRSQIITVDELESLFLEAAPDVNTPDESIPNRKTTIGLVGYPNVGKSSTINALMGAKKVSVSATPGKTKHFQTLHLSDHIVLCDCPGLVFPNFANTKADLVVNGVLPIDQLREFLGPAGIVAHRIPKHFLEAVYGMKIPIRPIQEGGTGVATAAEVLRAYARARGFATTGLGQPDESRAARYILKDYVSGKLLFCQPPPASPPIQGKAQENYEHKFNKELYDVAHLPANRQEAYAGQWDALTSESADNVDMDEEEEDIQSDIVSPPTAAGPYQPSSRARNLDSGFFTAGNGSAGRVRMPFNHQYSEQGAKEKEKELSGRKAKQMVALKNDIPVSEVKGPGKKHFKGGKKTVRAKKGQFRSADEDW